MDRLTILAAASVIALTAGGSSMAGQHPVMVFTSAKVNPVVYHAKGMKMLYSQNSNANGLNIDSQNYTSGAFASYNDEGADDFIVPKGQMWTVTEVDVTGCCAGTGGTAQ